MAHFAQLDENNVVTQVIVVGNDDIKDVHGVEVEEIGIAFCKKILGGDTKWKQTSYNNSMRFRYAGIGYSYDEELDAFIAPQPFPSWTLDLETTDWVSPLGDPPTITKEDRDLGKYIIWDEEAYQADNTTGWFIRTAGVLEEETPAEESVGVATT